MDLRVDRVSQEWPSTCTRSATPPACRRRSLSESSNNMGELFQEQLQALRARSLERKLRQIGSAQGPQIQIAGRRLINFSSNDYLGLASDSRLREAAVAAIKEFGV